MHSMKKQPSAFAQYRSQVRANFNDWKARVKADFARVKENWNAFLMAIRDSGD
jgi:hypothetical protein